MTFTEWYKQETGEDWHKDFGELYSYANELSIAYEEYCLVNNLKPIWNG